MSKNRCEYCKKEFETGRSYKKYCSYRCQNDQNKLKGKAKRREEAKEKLNSLPLKICEWCGEE